MSSTARAPGQEQQQVQAVLERCTWTIQACCAWDGHDLQYGLSCLKLIAGSQTALTEDYRAGACAGSRQALLQQAKPLISALHAFNAFTLRPSPQARTYSECECRVTQVSAAANLFSTLLGTARGVDALTLPPDMAEWLLGGITLSLEAGTLTLNECLALQSTDSSTSMLAFMAFCRHLNAVGNVHEVASRLPGGPAAAAALLVHDQVLPLVEAAVSAFERQKKHLKTDWMEGGFGARVLQGLSGTVTAVCAGISSPAGPAGACALAAAPETHRRLALMLFSMLHSLVEAAPRMREEELLALAQGLAAPATLVAAGGSPPPWAEWAAEQSGVLALALGAAPLSPVQRETNLALRISAAAGAAQTIYELVERRHGESQHLQRSSNTLLRSTTCALSHAAAGLMLLADQLLPEPRFEGAAQHVLPPKAAPPLAGADPGSNSGDASASASSIMEGVYAASGLVLRLFGALPLLLMDPSPQDGERLVGLVGDLLGTAVLSWELGAALDSADVYSDVPPPLDLAVTAAKVAVSFQQSRSFETEPEFRRAFVTEQLGATAGACSKHMRLLQHRSPEADDSHCGDALWLPRVQGVIPVILDGWRAVHAMPSTCNVCEASVLRQVVDTVCGMLCALPGLADAVEEAGGFQLLADQAAVVFNAHAPGAVLGSLKSQQRARNALTWLSAAIDPDAARAHDWVPGAVALSPLPATLAAWAAAALRSDEQVAVVEVLPAVAKFLNSAWVWAWEVSMELAVEASNDVGSESAKPGPGLDLFQRWASFEGLTADEYERVALEIMPQVAAGLQKSRALVTEGSAERALHWARSMATRRCSNPRCITLAGCSERKQPGKLCAGCKAARYCSRACQKADWKAHKAVCPALAADNVAAAAQE